MNELKIEDICLPDFLPDGGIILRVQGCIMPDNPFTFISSSQFYEDGDIDSIKRKICRLLNFGAQTIVFACAMPDDKIEYVYLNRMFLTF